MTDAKPIERADSASGLILRGAGVEEGSCRRPAVPQREAVLVVGLGEPWGRWGGLLGGVAIAGAVRLRRDEGELVESTLALSQLDARKGRPGGRS
jgi:hypothetical protein